jgi:hypothetical protein
MLQGGAHSRLHAPMTALTTTNTAQLGFRTDDASMDHLPYSEMPGHGNFLQERAQSG